MQDISRQIGIAIRWLPLILVGALVAGGVAYAYSSAQPKVYVSTATLRVLPGPDPSSQDLDVAESAASRYAEQAGSRTVAQGVIERLELDEDAGSLQERISTEVNSETFEVALTVSDEDPETARALANGLGTEMRSRVRNLLITDQVRAVSDYIATNRKSIRTLENRLRFLRRKQNKTPDDRAEIISLAGQVSSLQRDIQFYQEGSRAYVRNLLEWVQRPAVPDVPVEPRPLYWTLLALVAGGMLAAGLAFVLEYLRSVGKIKEDRDLELATGQATLGEVFETGGDARRGDADRLVTLNYPRSDEAEAYRGLIARAGFSGGASRTIMVTSPKASDAKSVVAANIAVAYAEAGRNVILVDANYRSPRIHGFFGATNDRGLTSILSDSSTPLGWATVPSPHPRLGLMPAGPVPREAAEPLGERQLNALLRRLLQAADLVVFDSPAIASSLDAAVLAAEVDGAILVVPRQSTEDEVVEAARALESANAEFVGAALYRKVRRSRKGARASVAPAPKGWGPTWPMMYQQPAQIPAAARSARPKEPAAPGPVQRPAPATQPPQRFGPTAGPYAVPFAADPNAGGTGAAPRPAVNPAAAPPPSATSAPPSATSATPSAAAPTSNPAAATPNTARVAIPVQPQEATERRGEATDSSPGGGGPARSPGSVQARPESIPG